MTTYQMRLARAMGDSELYKTPTELARAIGCTSQAISQALSGASRKLGAENHSKAAAALNVSPVWLATGDGPMHNREAALRNHIARQEQDYGGGVDEAEILSVSAPRDGDQYVTLPRLAVTASMGDGLELPSEDAVIDRMTIKRDWLNNHLPSVAFRSLAIISGKGDSMYPTFSDGDLLLVDTSKVRVDVDGIYVLSAHDRLFIKRVRQKLNGEFEISSDNPNVKTVDVLNGGNEITVHGRVVWAWNGKKL